MDSLGLKVCFGFLLTTFAGVALGQLPGVGQQIPTPSGKPQCSLKSLVPCINQAAESYLRNTMGEEVAKTASQNMPVMQKIAKVLMRDITAKDSDLNETCEVLTHMDTKGLAKCFDDNTKDCSIDPVGEKMVGVPKVPPGLINMSFSSLPTLEHALCNYECMNAWSISEKSAAMVACWKQHKTTLDAAVASSIPPSDADCRNIEEFAMCQWNNSVGCLFFEQLAQNYLGSLTPVFDRCAIALPQRALRQGPGKTGSDGMRTTSSPIMLIMSGLAGLLWTSGNEGRSNV